MTMPKQLRAAKQLQSLLSAPMPVLLRSLLRADEGSSLVELAFLTPLLFLLLLGTLDFGRAYYLAMEIAGAAQSGAVYGSTSPTDTTGMTAAATQDAPDVPGLSVSTPTFGCECSDGTLYSASCSSSPTSCANNVVYRVKVTVSATYKPMFPWPGVPSTIKLTNTASMRSGG
jgi:Flp pilus assembly protein TadG